MTNKLVLKSLLGAAVALVFAGGMLFAKGENINLIYRGRIDNHLTLAPGNYKMDVTTAAQHPEAIFSQNGKVIGEAPVKVVAEASKNSQTQIYYSSPDNHVRQITQIDVGGKRDHLMFHHS